MNQRILQLKIVLRGINPPIWRRVLVSDAITFHKLHRIIQAAMGWFECHLYEFRVGGSFITIMTEDMEEDADIEDSKKMKLNSFAFKAGAKFAYIYDFGDDWQHEICVEKVLEPEEGALYPFCIGGERNCPPENIGGPWGYKDFLEAIRDPAHPHYLEFTEPDGGCFNPEEFDIETANIRLGELSR